MRIRSAASLFKYLPLLNEGFSFMQVPSAPAINEITNGLERDSFGFFGYYPYGFLTGRLPTSVFDKTPILSFIYVRPNAPGVRRELIAQFVDWINTHGYTTFRATNQSGHPDEAWARAINKSATRVGTVMEFSTDGRPFRRK